MKTKISPRNLGLIYCLLKPDAEPALLAAGKRKSDPTHGIRFAGRGETPHVKYAKVVDDELVAYGLTTKKDSSPEKYLTDDLMMIIVTVGKGWMKEEFTFKVESSRENG